MLQLSLYGRRQKGEGTGLDFQSGAGTVFTALYVMLLTTTVHLKKLNRKDPSKFISDRAGVNCIFVFDLNYIRKLNAAPPPSASDLNSLKYIILRTSLPSSTHNELTQSSSGRFCIIILYGLSAL